MTYIEAYDATNAFMQICDNLCNYGVTYECRGSQKVVELDNVIVEIKQPRARLVSCKERNMPVKNSKREFIWYMTHNNEVKHIAKYMKMWGFCSDDNVHVNSNYGTIWHKPLPHIIERLKHAKESNEIDRRCVLSIYDNSYATYNGKDMPCTLAVTFSLRNNVLDMTVMMRSNDVVTGFCIDVFTWTCLQELIANELGVQMGKYTHLANSMHMYEKHWDSLLKHKTDFTIDDEKELQNANAGISHDTTYSNFWTKLDSYFCSDDKEWSEWLSTMKQETKMSISMM